MCPPFQPHPCLRVRVHVSARMGGLPALPEDGYWIENAPVNEVFQYLARSAGMQFFFNNELSTPQYMVTGHLRLDNPRQQMEDLAVAYGLTVYQQRSTVSLLTEAQLSRLPVEVMSYQLKYLRGAPLNRSAGASRGSGGEGEGGGSGGGGGGAGQADFEKLKAIIKPMLTRDVGQIEFEEKTNTLLVSDNSVKLERVRKLLAEIDRAKQQILVNVRVLRIKRNQGRQVGIDWRKSLGDNGTTLTATQSLNSLFNLPDVSTMTRTGTPTNMSTTLNKSYAGDGIGLVFGNVQVQAILRALEEADLVTQEACPTIITEDNEQGVISIVDRFPIITADIVNSTGGTNITEEIRYLVDKTDPSASDEPEKSREIGVTLSVTPTLLPDGTVRMKLRPRVAKIVELVPGRTGNVYPRVSESTVEAISRIPAGQSLFLGGFYDYNSSDGGNKVPVLGSVPIVKRLFSSTTRKMEQVSLVFVITPRVYDASDADALPSVNWDTREFSGLQPGDLPDASLFPASAPALPPPAPLSALPAAPALPAVPISDAPRPSWFQRVFNRKSQPALAEAPLPTKSIKPPGTR